MRTYLIRRFLQIIPVMIGILIVIFIIIELSPGGPVGNFMDPRMTAAQRADIAERFGLNDPVHVRFFSWITAALQGDFGRSFQFRAPVLEAIRPMVGPTVALGLMSMVLSMVIGIPAGIISATRQYSAADYGFTIFALAGISLPTFFFALLLLRIFSAGLGWFPLFGLQDPMFQAPNAFAQILHMGWHLFLPTLVLGLAGSATFMRYTRSSMLEVIKSDYIRTARAKGLRERVVIYRHAFRNAILPIITLLGLWIPGLFSGAIMVESIFGLPGLGRVAVAAVGFRDFPIIIATTALIALLTLISTIIADILYASADPRIRYD